MQQRQRERFSWLNLPQAGGELDLRRPRTPGRQHAAVVLAAVRRPARRTLVYVHALILVSALLGAVAAHHVIAQLSPPSPPAAVCGNSAILDGPSSPPAGAVSVPAGDNSDVDFTTPDATYYFETGTHTIGTGEFDQIDPGDGSTFLGAPGAILDGQDDNQFAFAGSSSDVTIEYLTIQDFIPPGSEGAVNINGEPGWNESYDTEQDNLPGAATMLGSDAVLNFDCLTENGEYGFNAYTVNDVSELTGGPSDITMTNNEISYNNTCNWEDLPPDEFPITPPAGCDGAGQFDGCGCSGGGKFWAVDGATISGNYVHGNYSTGLWADTNNVGFALTGNYISGNLGDGFIYEISYNFLITGNTFVSNAVIEGPLNPGFPSSAIYISESGSDSRVPGPYGSQAVISGNGFYDNWGGVILWENANRYCGSSANTSTGYCTLVDPQATLQTCGQPYPVSQAGPVRVAVPPGRRTPGTAGSGHGQVFTSLLFYQPYYSDCRWKTQNVSVSGNVFDFTSADIGADCTVANFCGFNGVFSEFGTYPPYTGTVVETDITFNQDNVFSGNTYCGPWMFDAMEQGDQWDWATWQGTYGQDAGSSLNGAACTAVTAPPSPGMRRAPVVIPYRAGRR